MEIAGLARPGGHHAGILAPDTKAVGMKSGMAGSKSSGGGTSRMAGASVSKVWNRFARPVPQLTFRPELGSLMHSKRHAAFVTSGDSGLGPRFRQKARVEANVFHGHARWQLRRADMTWRTSRNCFAQLAQTFRGG
jgi:hypothetical protein